SVTPCRSPPKKSRLNTPVARESSTASVQGGCRGAGGVPHEPGQAGRHGSFGGSPLRKRSGKISYPVAPCSHAGVVKSRSYTVSWNESPRARVVLPVPPLLTSLALLSSPYQRTPFAVTTRNAYDTSDGFAGGG